MGINPIIKWYSSLGKESHLGRDAIKLMDEVGIDKIIAFPEFMAGQDYTVPNRIVSKEMKKYPERIIGFGRVNPSIGPDVSTRVIDVMCTKLGLKGLKLHPLFDYFVANDEVLVYPIMERAKKYKIPVLFHSGEVWSASPTLIADTASAFPEVPVIIAHSGILEYTEEAIVVAKKTENVYMDTSICAWTYHVNKAVNKVGADKILFGSDAPYQACGLEIDKLVKYSGLKVDQLRKIFSENIRGILKMPA